MNEIFHMQAHAVPNCVWTWLGRHGVASQSTDNFDVITFRNAADGTQSWLRAAWTMFPRFFQSLWLLARDLKSLTPPSLLLFLLHGHLPEALQHPTWAHLFDRLFLLLFLLHHRCTTQRTEWPRLMGDVLPPSHRPLCCHSRVRAAHGFTRPGLRLILHPPGL